MKNQKLRKVIREFLKEEFAYLIEGVDVDAERKTVSFNAFHENNVNTSVLINPTFLELNGIKIISIFKRKRSEDSIYDGNPLIYALKGIKGWKFLNPKEDIINLLKQFIRIAEKIEEKYDTIITVPSSNELNTKFLYRLNKIIKAEYKISDYFGKMYSEDVLFDYINWEQMRLDLGGGFDKAKKELEQCFFKMEIENNGIFSFKYIKDVGLRKYIQNSMNADIEKTFEIAPFVDGKNILILDDTISSGASISEACKLIVDTFTPNSVTVVTLFSKL